MPAFVTLSKSRIESLSDGVFSIAMTLLVLKLEVPEVMHHSSNQAMLQQMLALTPEFVTYVVTFMIAGGFWFLQHLEFHAIRHSNSVFVWMNLFFLMLIALLPFSAGLMSHLLVHPVSQLFYFGNHLAIALLLNVQWHYARWNGLAAGADPAEVASITLRAASTVVVFAACLITSIFLPAWSWAPLALMLPSLLIIEKSRRRRRVRANA